MANEATPSGGRPTPVPAIGGEDFRAYLEVLRTAPCCVCREPAEEVYPLRIAAHRSLRPWSVPLCALCEAYLHSLGAAEELTWFQAKGVDAPALATRLWAFWHDRISSQNSLVWDPIVPPKRSDLRRAHHCHAVGCGTVVPEHRLMCRRHWFMVPKALRDEVWRTYRPGQERDKTPSRPYLAAAAAAIEAVRLQGEKPSGLSKNRRPA